MQKLTAPGATIDKTKGNKMFLQGKTAVGESIKTSIKTLMAIAWVEFGMPPPPTKKKKKNLIHRGRDQPSRGGRVQTDL